MGKLKQLADKKKAEKAQIEKVKMLREFIKTTFYPFIKNTSKSINDADLFCQQISVSLRTAFNNQMLRQTIKDLDLSELTEERYKKLFEIMANMTLTDSLMIVDGLSQAINACVKREQIERKIEELKDLEKDFS
jgi:hypothetical protein